MLPSFAFRRASEGAKHFARIRLGPRFSWEVLEVLGSPSFPGRILVIQVSLFKTKSRDQSLILRRCDVKYVRGSPREGVRTGSL